MNPQAPKIFRLCLTGSECTGKTTLARELAARWGAVWVPEAARAYAERHGGVLGARDVGQIAEQHLAAEAAGLRAAQASTAQGGTALLILDADLISTVVYARFYYGGCPPWIEHAARAERADHYLLCGYDVPWQADGVRDQPGARLEIQTAFRAALLEFGAKFTEIAGTREERNRLCEVWRKAAF